MCSCSEVVRLQLVRAAFVKIKVRNIQSHKPPVCFKRLFRNGAKDTLSQSYQVQYLAITSLGLKIAYWLRVGCPLISRVAVIL